MNCLKKVIGFNKRILSSLSKSSNQFPKDTVDFHKVTMTSNEFLKDIIDVHKTTMTFHEFLTFPAKLLSPAG